MVLDKLDHGIIAAIQHGLPVVSRPFADIAGKLGISEQEVQQRIRKLQQDDVIKRFGVVVRHHELGYHANAMVVWDIPDDRVDEIGRRLSEIDCVTLCYRRPRRLPLWPYNLFCMIHGKERQSVLTRLNEIIQITGMDGVEHRVLFSTRRFKQRGARYVPTGEQCHG